MNENSVALMHQNGWVSNTKEDAKELFNPMGWIVCELCGWEEIIESSTRRIHPAEEDSNYFVLIDNHFKTKHKTQYEILMLAAV